MLVDIDRALDALLAIPADLPRADWVRAGMAAQAAGLGFEAFNNWSASADNYSEQDARSTWKSFSPGKGVGAGTLFKLAAENGWRMGDGKPKTLPIAKRLAAAPRTPPSACPVDIMNRFQPATASHPYIAKKRAAGVPLDALRVVPAGDRLEIAGESMAGALVVPVTHADGTVSSLQFIVPPDVATRLKSKGKPGKLNLPGCPVQGSYTVGQLLPGDVAYIVEGIGAAWSCWQATGAAAVVCFGAGRMRTVASELRQRDPTARLVLVPDVGKESDAQKIALEVGALVATMPEGEDNNFDASDLAQRDGGDALAALLKAAREPAKPEPRYKLLTGAQLAALPALAWRVRGVLPAVGLAGLVGPSASGKSFLAFDMVAAIASEQRWFGCRVEAAPVVYAALEGEAGFKLRAQAWETHRGRALPDAMRMMLQPFTLTSPQDVTDLAAVVPAGAVVVIDTLNRAAPIADENSSKDMGEILQAAKTLQAITGGLVLLVHHTGKDVSRGMRGHSSLFAAMDAVVEVSRDGDRREWRVAKSKDGADGDGHPFKLHIETLGVDEHGDPVTSCVVVRDTAAEDVHAVRLPQGSNQKLTLEALLPLFASGSTGKTGAPPISRCIELETAIVAASSHLACENFRRSTRAREAITGLVTRGVLGLNEGWLWLMK